MRNNKRDPPEKSACIASRHPLHTSGRNGVAPFSKTKMSKYPAPTAALHHAALGPVRHGIETVAADRVLLACCDVNCGDI